MKVYTYSEARRLLGQLLDEVLADGEVRIKRPDGRVFALKEVARPRSPLDVPGIDIGITREEILDVIAESMSRS